PFIVMDVMEAARAAEEGGRHIIHMEVGQPSTPAPQAAREALKRGADGVVCGHIHSAEMRMIDGIHYCNDGDWVESCTALVEHHDGRMELLDWGALRETLKDTADAPVDRDRRLVPAG
ncbi:MAG: hypothetical protein AAFO68_03820, partial [Pseudomonadota bacterium]